MKDEMRATLAPARLRRVAELALVDLKPTMNTQANLGSTLKHPSAFLPVTMSFAALAIVLFHIAMFGAAREADEGTAAHLWQILMVAQLPFLGFFAAIWLPRSPRQALLVLALQTAAIIAALAPVYLLGL